MPRILPGTAADDIWVANVEGDPATGTCGYGKAVELFCMVDDYFLPNYSAFPQKPEKYNLHCGFRNIKTGLSIG